MNMPVAWLRAHAEMMPRLVAEEELVRLNANLHGSGMASQKDVRSYSRDLARVARGGDDEKPVFKTPREAARMIGIPIVRQRNADG